MHGFNGFFVESQTQGPDHTRVGDVALRVDHDPQHHDSLVLGLAGLFGVGRLRLVDRNRRADSVAYAVNAVALTSAFTRTKSAAFAWSNAGPFARPNPAARTRSVRRRSWQALRISPG